MFKLFRKKKHWLERPNNILLALGVVIIITIIYAVSSFGGAEDVAPEEVTIATPVRAAAVSTLKAAAHIKTTGIVKPETKVDVVTLVNGTVQQSGFEIGDTVAAGQIMARVYDATTMTNLTNAITNFNNTQLSTDATTRFADESVRQAEVSLQNAQESLQSAVINLEAAQNNLDNTLALQEREVEDTYTAAVISANDYLNTINNSLEQVDFIIDAEEESQLPGIEATIAALDAESLLDAEKSYFAARDEYYVLVDTYIDAFTIEATLLAMIDALELTNTAVDDVIRVLDNTIPNPSFSDADLLGQKNTFSGVRSSVVGTLTAAQLTEDGLSNLDLVHKQQRDSLESAVAVAESQLVLAELSATNAEVAVSQAESSRNQQVFGAQTSLDASSGQLSLAQEQVHDLIVRAPISGQIIFKNIESGSEVVPGQKIAEISQSDLVKVVVELASDEIYQVALGDVAILNEELQGTIVRIDPSADPVSRKVGVEVIFDNSARALIPETFVDVTIPLNGTRSVDAVYIPIKTVSITPSESFVWVVGADNTAQKHVVMTGDIRGDQIEIVSGLANTDVLIIEGNKLLEQGQSVEVVQ